MEDLFSHVVSNSKFLYSAFYACDNQMVLRFFEEHGLKTKVERGNRVFPVSDHSSDVIAALQRALKEVHVQVQLHTKVSGLLAETGENLADGKQLTVTGVKLSDGKTLLADHVILATGGCSYPSTGATGDGYRFAQETGHTIVPQTPSLVPFEVKEEWCTRLQGLSLRNIEICIRSGKKLLYQEFGELLFTHFGVSGPVILSASAAIPPKYFSGELPLFIDLKPALTEEQLDKRILRDFEEAKNKSFKNSLGALLPAKMIPVLVELSGIDPEKKVNEISKEERKTLVLLIKNLPLTVTGLRGWNEAIITKGGVSVKNINPSTMASKVVKNLSICGEVLDLDAYTGGYNLQIAWSTGYLAGSSINELHGGEQA
jgi:predicted Rossmann fold flavoprotein